MLAGKGRIETLIDRYVPRSLRPQWEKLRGSQVGYRLAHGAFWSIAGAVISRGLALVSAIVVARILGKEGFGEFGVVQSTVAMFQSFAGFGLGLTATKHVAEFKYRDPQRAGRIIALSSVVALVTGLIAMLGLYFAASLLATRTLAAPGMAGLLRLSSIMLFLGAVNGAQTGALSGFEAFKHLYKVNLFSGVASFVCMVGGVLVAGLTGSVVGLVLSMAVNCLLNHRALRYEAGRIGVPLQYAGCLQEWRGVWRFCLLATLSGVIVTPVTWACNAIMVNQPGGYGELGVYNAVTKIKQVPEMILLTVMNPLLPMLSEQYAAKDGAAYGKTLSMAYLSSTLVMVPVSLLVVYCPELVLLPYGRAYADNATLVQWLFIHAIMVGLFSPLSSVLASTNTMVLGLVYNVAFSILFLCCSWYLVPTMLAAGLAMSLCIATLAASVPCLVYIDRRYKYFTGRFPLGYVSFACISTGLAALWVYALPVKTVSYLAGGALSLVSLALLVNYMLKFGNK